jgi:hypothetical protein
MTDTLNKTTHEIINETTHEIINETTNETTNEIINETISEIKIKKCIIICNGPSVNLIKNYNFDYSEYDIIAVNRWNNIFAKLNLPDPNIVIVGKNSLVDNMKNIYKYKKTQFYGLDKHNAKNYYVVNFNIANCYSKNVIMLNAMWWSGIYAVQHALKNEYQEIHLFGFTCTDQNDYKDTFIRATIPYNKIQRLQKYFSYLKDMDVLKYITLYENNKNHILANYFKI